MVETHACPISAGVVSGAGSADQLGGPIMIAQVSGQVATLGFAAFMHFVAVLSVSIGLLNLFPVPLLDGGHLLFYAVEASAGQAAVGTGAGDRFPDRVRARRHVDDLCDQKRHLPACAKWTAS